MDLLTLIVVAASTLVVTRLLLNLLLPAYRRLGRGRLHVEAEWRQHFAAGQSVLLVVGETGATAELAAFAGRSGCMVSTLGRDRASLPKSSEQYDAVVVDRYLSALPEDEAKDVLGQLCSLLSGGGVLLIQDFAVLPASQLVSLAQSMHHLLESLWASVFVCDPRLHGPPYDTAAWLPNDVTLEARLAAGGLLEALTVRKLAAAPNQAVEHLRRLHGDTSMAFCTSPEANRIGTPEQGIRYFLASASGSSSGDNYTAPIGYVSYVEHVIWGVRLRLVLMDPVCAPESRLATLRAFLADCDATQSRPIFSCISDDWKAALQQCGLHTTMLGGEIGIRLANYTLSKDRRRYLRAAPAKGLECHTECNDMQELQELNSTWIGNKASGAEILIWTWPPSLPEAEADGETQKKPDEVRRLYTYQNGRLVGFVCAEPYYRGDGSGEVLGYGLNTIRFLPSLSPPWISDFTVATLIQNLQAEGKADFLAFGLSPFCDVAAHGGDLPWLRSLNQFAWTINAESVYPIQGLAKKKAHHCAGQGIRLHDRLVSADPAFALGDTLRFMTLLFGSTLHKLPEALGCIVLGAVSSSAARCTCLARACISAVRDSPRMLFWRSAQSASEPSAKPSKQHDKAVVTPSEPSRPLVLGKMTERTAEPSTKAKAS